MDLGAGRGACGDVHGWDREHLALPREDAKRTSVTARDCASPRRCQGLGIRWRSGTAPRPSHTHPCATIQTGLSTGRIKDSSFLLGGRAWRRTPDPVLGVRWSPDHWQARYQFFVYTAVHARPGVPRCLHLPRSVGHIARAGFPYGFCLLAGVDCKMQ